MDENLNIEHHVCQMILVALNTSCCFKESARKLGITDRTLKAYKREYGIVRQGRHRYVKKHPSPSMRPLQSVA